MMRHLHSLAALLLTALLHAQTPLPFPVSNAIWTNVVYDVHPLPPTVTYTLQQRNSYCIGTQDTIINAISYAQVYRCGGAYKGALRDDAGQVWYVAADSVQEHLLYDFTLEVGESAVIYYETLGFVELYEVTVQDVYNDIYLDNRRVLQLSNGAEWVEGIGPRWGLFTEPWYNISNYTVELECMSHADTILYPSNSAGPGHCELIMAVQAPVARNTMSVSPNPTNGLLRCEGVARGEIVQLTTADGRVLPLLPTWNGATATIDMGHCTPGLYFLRIGNGTTQRVSAVIRE